MDHLQSRTLVLIPAFNEEATVGQIVSKIKSHGWTCLVVNDGSTDTTGMEAKKYGAIVLHHKINLGVGLALQTGFKWACSNGYQRVIQVDADGQHNEKQIQNLLEEAERTEAHLLIGSRFLNFGEAIHEIPRHRKLTMQLLSKIIRHKTGIRITDTTSGFRCISEPLLSQFACSFSGQYLGDTFEANLTAAQAGYSIHEIHTEMSARLAGSSSANFYQAIRQVVRILIISLTNLNFKIEKHESH